MSHVTCYVFLNLSFFLSLNIYLNICSVIYGAFKYIRIFIGLVCDSKRIFAHMFEKFIRLHNIFIFVLPFVALIWYWQQVKKSCIRLHQIQVIRLHLKAPSLRTIAGSKSIGDPPLCYTKMNSNFFSTTQRQK